MTENKNLLDIIISKIKDTSFYYKFTKNSHLKFNEYMVYEENDNFMIEKRDTFLLSRNNLYIKYDEDRKLKIKYKNEDKLEKFLRENPVRSIYEIEKNYNSENNLLLLVNIIIEDNKIKKLSILTETYFLLLSSNKYYMLSPLFYSYYRSDVVYDHIFILKYEIDKTEADKILNETIVKLLDF